MRPKVVVVGVGALGSHVVLCIRNMDVDITVIDFDRVEAKNVLSQFHPKSTVGNTKVMGLQRTMQFLFNRKIDIVPHRLNDQNADILLAGAALVIDCLDNAASRKSVQRIVQARSIPCVHGALAADGAFGRSVWDDQFVIDDETDAGAATCEDGEQLPFVVETAAFIARSVQEFFSKNRQIGFEIARSDVWMRGSQKKS